MIEWFYVLFTPSENPEMTQSLIVLFMAISIGFFVGKIRIGSISLGVSAVLFVGLFLGHLGYTMNVELIPFIREFGLILFVYGIGIQVGPTFFSSFKKEGLIFNSLGVGTVFLGGIIAYLIHHLANIKIENSVGLMSGAVTNTPGLGAAKTTLIEIQKQLNLPINHFSDPAIAYAITYPIGVFGIILMIILTKHFLKIDLKKEEDLLNEQNNDSENKIIIQKCRVTKPEVIGKTIKQIFREFHFEDIIISRQKHSGTIVVYSPSLDSIINEKDVLMVVAKQKELNKFIEVVGKVSTDLFIESQNDITTKILSVTKNTATHKTLAQLDLYNNYDVIVTRVIRSGLEILAQPSLELFYGDTLMVVGSISGIEEAEKIIGNSKKLLLEPDFLSLFGGLIFGVIIGSIPIIIPTLPVPLKLGLAAGPLLAALFISRYGGVGVFNSYINNGAIHFMKDFGICLFFAAVGIKAGHGFYDNFIANNGWMWIYYGCYITFIPLIILVLVSRYIFKLNYYQMVGIMSGSYTDPAALAFSTKYLDSDIPNQSYATVYPLITISRILVAQLLVLLFAS